LPKVPDPALLKLLLAPLVALNIVLPLVMFVLLLLKAFNVIVPVASA
jgi:hypothetical protein